MNARLVMMMIERFLKVVKFIIALIQAQVMPLIRRLRDGRQAQPGQA